MKTKKNKQPHLKEVPQSIIDVNWVNPTWDQKELEEQKKAHPELFRDTDTN